MDSSKPTRGTALPYLHAWRQYKGLSQRELSEYTRAEDGTKPVPYSQISRIESQGQHVTPGTIRKLADALGISREDLINVDPRKRAPASDANTSGHASVGTSRSTPATSA